MKRRLFSSLALSIASVGLLGQSHASEGCAPLKIARSKEYPSCVEVTGTEEAVVSFALAWQDSLWPDWRRSEVKTAPTVESYRSYVKSMMSKGEACTFYAKGKIFTNAVTDAVKEVSATQDVCLSQGAL